MVRRLPACLNGADRICPAGNGNGYCGLGIPKLRIYATDPTRSSKSGVLLMHDEAGYQQLKELIKKTHEWLWLKGQMPEMVA